MVIVARKALIRLGASDIPETASDKAVHAFTILKQADDVVDADACTLDDGMASIK